MCEMNLHKNTRYFRFHWYWDIFTLVTYQIRDEMQKFFALCSFVVYTINAILNYSEAILILQLIFFLNLIASKIFPKNAS